MHSMNALRSRAITRSTRLVAAIALMGLAHVRAEAPARREIGQTVLEGVPEIPQALRERMNQYLNVRAASFADFSDDGTQILISTRFGNTDQLHLVSSPMGARKQLTFSNEPIRGGAFLPGSKDRKLFYFRDTGGNEYSQLYLFNLDDGRETLLTDGKSRHESLVVARSGKIIAFTGTGRNKRDGDIYVAAAPDFKPRLLMEVNGAFYPRDFNADGSKLTVVELISVKESYLYVVDVATGKAERISPKEEKFAYSGGAFSADGKSLFFTSDKAGQFQNLYRRDLASGNDVNLTPKLNWDVDGVTVAPSGDRIAFVTNEDGQSKVYLAKPDAAPNDYQPVSAIPMGLIGGLSFSNDGKRLSLTLTTPTAPSDVYILTFADNKLTRWTESEIGGLNPAKFATPTRIEYPTFDDADGGKRKIPAYYYRPAGNGPFPVIISIHGGPESQERPRFSSLYQYWVTEMNCAVLVPNVRGSTGYGRDYHMLDDGFKREDSVKDIGALLDWVGAQKELDAKRVAVYGGSYGGYMVLACLTHFPERIKAGVDIVGIANFVTFLEKTAPYRVDLRRVEYGDERDPKMLEFLKKISPLANADKITSALFVQHGANDPRVPAFEAEQIVKGMRDRGRTVWYMLAKDEGHGFAKKENRDIAILTATMFLDEQLSPTGARKEGPAESTTPPSIN